MSGRHGAAGTVLLAALVGGALGCAGPGATATPTGPRVELTTFAAASLATVLRAAATAYAADEPRVRVVLSTGSSTALRTQIEQGAPADLFLSADTANPQALLDGGLADGEAVVFAGNGLAIVVPDGDPAGIATPANLARDGVRLIVAGEQVPITRYALELLGRLAAQPGYPTDFLARTEANIVSREDDVLAVAAKVALGEGDAGIVYGTDARANGALDTVPLPPGVDVRAAYAGVVVAGSPEAAHARAFLTWLLGPRGQAVLAAAGFLPAPP
ncbi:MAG: molybdate ABC transporter substrate-binding protein [Candidatus Limnocylindria bacterium]